MNSGFPIMKIHVPGISVIKRLKITTLSIQKSKCARVNQYYKQPSKWNEKPLVSSSKSTPFKQSNE